MLLGAYVEAAKEKDDYRNLPLHLAIQNQASMEVIQMLLGAYGEATKETDTYGRLPLRLAAENQASNEIIVLLGGSPTEEPKAEEPKAEEPKAEEPEAEEPKAEEPVPTQEAPIAAAEEAMEGFHALTRSEGILCALETAHAVAHAMKLAQTMRPEQSVVLNLSGRGDKDLYSIAEREGWSL